MNKRVHEHHIWCNYFMYPRKGCKMCARLFEEYPYKQTQDPKEAAEKLLKKHFPDVGEIGGNNATSNTLPNVSSTDK